MEKTTVEIETRCGHKTSNRTVGGSVLVLFAGVPLNGWARHKGALVVEQIRTLWYGNSYVFTRSLY